MLVGARRVVGDNGNGALVGNHLAEVVGVVGRVGHDDFGGKVFDQGTRLGHIAHLARRKRKAHRASQSSDSQVDFGAQAAARTANGLILSPPFAPLACWEARTMVESTIRYSKSGSSDMASKMRHHTPLRLHRLKRRKTLFQSPNASGRSRQGDPVRTIHSTPFDKHPIIAPSRTLLVGTTDDQTGQPLPLHVAQYQTIHNAQDCLPKSSLESHIREPVNP